MCILMEGEIRSTFSPKKNPDLEILNVLVNFGKFENIVQVANFANQKFKPGPVVLKVVPSAKAKNDRAFINWATYDGVK